MTKQKFANPHSKVRGRRDGTTVTATIPGKIAHPLRLKPGDIVEWVLTTEGYTTYVKMMKAAE